MNDFEKYAKSNRISTIGLHQYKKGFTPMIMEESQLNASVISVFDRLMMDRIIFLGEEIDEFIANIINAQLLYLANQSADEHISIYINSPGGDCYSGLAIHDTMTYVKPAIHTTVMGLAASMAFLIATSGEKKHRASLRNSRLMMHQPMGGQGIQQVTDIEIFNKEMLNIKNDMIDILSSNTGQTKEKIKFDAERDFWFRAQEAKDYGAIDKIVVKQK